MSNHFKGKIKPELINIHEDDTESADVIALISERIKGDFIVMSSDIITDANLSDLIDHHNFHNSTLTMLLRKEDLESGKKLGKAPVSCNLNDNYDIYFVNPENTSIAHVINTDEIDESGTYEVKRSVIIKYDKLISSLS